MIRPAEKRDASRLAEILIFAKRTAYRNIFNDDMVSFGEMQVLPLAMCFLNNPTLLEGIVVYDDGFVKGMANIKRSEGMLELKELYIDPFFQGIGIGGMLAAYAEQQASEARAAGIFLWVLEKNSAARAFYSAYGFTKAAERKLEQGTSEYVIKYIKKL